MNIEAVKALRKVLPIPLNEAKDLLARNNNNIEKCVEIYKEKAVNEISLAAKCSKSDALSAYNEESFDINKAISKAIENEYDKNYTPIEGVNKDTLLYAKDWLYLLEGKDLGATLGYKNLSKLIDVFKKIDKISHHASLIEQAKYDYDKIFFGYDDTMPMEEFIKRSSLLDASENFQKASKTIELEIESIKDELRRQWRNVNK